MFFGEYRQRSCGSGFRGYGKSFMKMPTYTLRVGLAEKAADYVNGDLMLLPPRRRIP